MPCVSLVILAIVTLPQVFRFAFEQNNRDGSAVTTPRDRFLNRSARMSAFTIPNASFVMQHATRHTGIQAEQYVTTPHKNGGMSNVDGADF